MTGKDVTKSCLIFKQWQHQATGLTTSLQRALGQGLWFLLPVSPSINRLLLVDLIGCSRDKMS
jgi:hypothetical protein